MKKAKNALLVFAAVDKENSIGDANYGPVLGLATIKKYVNKQSEKSRIFHCK